jgi:hypothetical protein
MLKSLAAGEIFVSEESKTEVFLQITQWNPLKKDNVDDVLDLLCYAGKVIEMYGEFVVAYNTIVQQEGDAIEVLGPERTCCF